MATITDRREVYLRAQALVSRVYSLPETEREPFVERETEADPQLRDEVRWLLEALAGPEDTFLEAPLLGEAPAESPDLKVPAPRNYTLIRPLGEGGMGVVYLAERIEGDLKQVVALKLLNLIAMLNPGVVSRFLMERQLLAKLNHPNIARLIDAGALADGRPFLAMEYVEGTELDRYCEDKQLGIKERLQLFVKVCQAVQYAHQHLIIHRDLKPANVLVTKEGEPKLVDFGIARIWSDKDGVTTQTMGAERIMTLAYASPEQLAGKPLSTMTDVYSLGIMLYELLAGERPWGAATEPLALARAIGESTPVPPSVKRRQTQGQAEAEKRGLTGLRWRLPNELPRDLDAIVLKALRLQPEERYGSVQALADDLERFRTNRPVKAREGHAWYRTRKYVRRNWAPLTVTAGIVLLTGGYIVDRQMQLDRTERERAKVQQVRDFLVGLFKEVQPAYAQGQNVSAKEMLDRGAKRLETAPPADPMTRMVLNSTLAETYESLGDVKTAVDFADRTVAQARAMPGVDNDSLAASLMTAINARHLRQGHGAASALAEEVLSQLDKSGKVSPEVLADALLIRARALWAEGRPLSASEPSLKQGIELLARRAPDSARVILIKSEYARQLLHHNQNDDALAIMRQIRADTRRIFGPTHPETYAQDSVYGEALDGIRRYREAETVLTETLAAQQRLLGDDHFSTGVTRARLSFVFQSEGKWAAAQPLLEQQLALTRRVHKYESQSTINALLNASIGLNYLGRGRESEQLTREALALVKTAIAPDQQNLWEGIVTARLAESLVAAGKPDEAGKLAERALRLLESSEGFPSFSGVAWRVLGQIANDKGNTAEAEKAYRNAYKFSKGNITSLALGPILIKQQAFAEAEQVLAPLHERLKQQMPADAPFLTSSRNAMIALYTDWGKPEEAARIRAESPAPDAKTAR